MNSEEKNRFEAWWRMKAERYYELHQEKLEGYFRAFDPELLQWKPKVQTWDSKVLRFTFEHQEGVYSLPRKALFN